jgi:hypothetical protein
MRLKLLLFAILTYFQSQAQNVPVDSIQQAEAYYKLAVQYKDGDGVPMDYKLAFDNFSKAASLGDPQSVYAIAYMHYKGLGCTQDYQLAATLFGKGAALGKDNSMYFYGLCFRNGYGRITNEDSAKHWLQKSAELGYRQAIVELAMSAGENSNDSAKRLVHAIHNAALPKNVVLNQYSKIENHLPPAEVIAGYYRGYIIQYDWSGKNAVSSKKLFLNLTGKGNDLQGYWSEEGTDSFKLKAALKLDSLVFQNTKYVRKDHYSPEKAIRYNFQNARFNLVQKTDSVFLAGNVEMFSPDRKEPSKPLFVALVRVENGTHKNAITGLRVSPNPFTEVLNVEFTLPVSAKVEVQLVSVDGAIVYRNPAGKLGAGHYLLPLQPKNIAPGTYLVKVLNGTHTTSTKVIKGAN